MHLLSVSQLQQPGLHLASCSYSTEAQMLKVGGSSASCSKSTAASSEGPHVQPDHHIGYLVVRPGHRAHVAVCRVQVVAVQRQVNRRPEHQDNCVQVPASQKHAGGWVDSSASMPSSCWTGPSQRGSASPTGLVLQQRGGGGGGGGGFGHADTEPFRLARRPVQAWHKSCQRWHTAGAADRNARLIRSPGVKALTLCWLQDMQACLRNGSADLEQTSSHSHRSSTGAVCRNCEGG